MHGSSKGVPWPVELVAEMFGLTKHAVSNKRKGNVGKRMYEKIAGRPVRQEKIANKPQEYSVIIFTLLSCIALA